MSIEFSGSGEMPRMERYDSSEQSRAPLLKPAQQADAQEPLQKVAEQVRTAVETQQADNERRREMSQDEIQEIVDSVATMAHALNRELRFSINSDNGDTVITVLDKNTGEKVRQIPSEEIVRLAERVQELSKDQLDSATGLLIDSQA